MSSSYSNIFYHNPTASSPVMAVRAQSALVPVALAAVLLTYAPSPHSVVFKGGTADAPDVHRAIDLADEVDREDLRAIARIRILGTYTAGWNGPGSIPPTRRAVKDSEQFTRYLFSLGAIVLPYISASSDGEINFYWKSDGFIIDLGFIGDGSYSYYAHLPNELEIIEDEASLNDPLPSEIIDLIITTA